MLKMTRSAALKAGLKKYYSGQPCQRGHNDYRYASNGMCCSCSAKYTHFVKSGMNYQDITIRVFNRNDVPLVRNYVSAINFARQVDDMLWEKDDHGRIAKR